MDRVIGGAGEESELEQVKEEEEAEERAEKWQEYDKKEKQSHEQEVSELRAQFHREIQEIVGPLVERINVLECRVKELETENEALREDNVRLKSIVKKKGDYHYESQGRISSI